MTNLVFYVYQYIDANGTPYYVGKGKGNRINTFHTHTVLPLIHQRVKLIENLTNEQAKKIEGELITKYGRKLDGGILDNIKINQWACFTGWKHSEKTKLVISEKNTGKKRSYEAKQKYKQPKTKEHAENIKNAVKNLWADSEYKQKRIETIRKKSFAHKGKPWSQARRKAYEDKKTEQKG